MSKTQSWLAEIGKRGEAPLNIADAGLRLAALDRPGIIPRITIDRYHHHLKLLASDVAKAGADATTASARAASLRDVLWQKHGYTGDSETCDNPENANLMSVIDRRKGLPVALAILYIHVARAQGWPAEGINFPEHFLIRVEGVNDRAIIDPFNDGRELDAGALRALIKEIAGPEGELQPGFYEPVSDRDILIRLQNNIRLRAFKAGDIPRAVEVLYRLVQLDPGCPEFWYELGMLEAHREHWREGQAALLKCLDALEQRPGGDDMRERIMETLGEIPPNMK
jgi:regulator of sirC expression with transglutaminase-like and TPR domain